HLSPGLGVPKCPISRGLGAPWVPCSQGLGSPSCPRVRGPQGDSCPQAWGSPALEVPGVSHIPRLGPGRGVVCEGDSVFGGGRGLWGARGDAVSPRCPQSQAAAHYQGNRHARRLKGLEAARARRGGDTGDTQDPPGPSPTPAGETPDRTGGFLYPRASPRVLMPPTKDTWVLCVPPLPRAPPSRVVVPRVPLLTLPVPAGEQPPAPAAPGAPGPPSPPAPPPAVATEAPGGARGGPGGEEEEEEKAKAKRLLYCALCKVAVNSLSQLEAHNKGGGRGGGGTHNTGGGRRGQGRVWWTQGTW
uniref:C2H2-type domain-containing protein n=1 Tax=Accipiter nisus TaxID=211598 RepID=A0A8B9MJF4_9AVES